MVAAVALLVSGVGWFAATDVDRTGVRTTGQVMEVFDPRKGPTEVWVSYLDARSGAAYVRHQYLFFHSAPAVGDRVPIAYRPDRPAEARATAWSPFWPSFVLGMGGAIGVVASLMAVWAWHEHRRQARERSVPRP